MRPDPRRRGSRRPRGAKALAAAAWAAALAACHVPAPTPELTWRRQRETAVRAALPPAQADAFPGLRYFAYDPAYRFQAMVQPVVPPEPLRMAASNGVERPAHQVGRVALRFPGGDATLAIYQLDDLRAVEPDALFLPFRDAGAGRTTYGSGRYLDVTRLPGGVVSLDFNRAYNPDCAYGIAGECPIAPEENTVPFPIRAGEKLPPNH